MDAIERKCLDNQKARVATARSAYEAALAKLTALETALNGAATVMGDAAATNGTTRLAVMDPGRRAKPNGAKAGEKKNGKRLTLPKAIQKVIGKRTMSRDDIVDGLKRRGLLPNSKDPKSYIGQTLSKMSVGGGPLARQSDGNRSLYSVEPS